MISSSAATSGLDPKQAQFVEWFTAFKREPVLLVAPPGAGKTRTAAVLTGLLLAEGPALVIVPDILVPVWGDQLASHQVDEQGDSDRRTVVLDRGSVAYFRAAQGVASDAMRKLPAAFIAPLSLARDSTLLRQLSEIEWNMLVVDDAGHVFRTAARNLVRRIARRKQARILAVAGALDEAGSVVTSSWTVIAWAPPGRQAVEKVSRIVVQADSAEAAFLSSVADWAQRGTSPPDRLLRRLVDRAASSNLGYAVQLLEHLAKRRAVDWESWVILSPEERGLLSSAKLSAVSRSDIRGLLTLAYAVSLPDGKTRRLIDALRNVRWQGLQ